MPCIYLKSGVIQGGILSSLLFIMLTYYMMMKLAERSYLDVVRKNENMSVDLDNVDSIALIYKKTNKIQRL